VDGGGRFWLAVGLRFCCVVDSDVAASCVRKGEGKGIHAAHLDIVGRSLLVATSLVATWPLLLV
jgi:hypothetical protein